MAKIIFMGTSEFACACLEALEQADLLPELIITRPDSVAGRNRRPAMPPVKKWGQGRGIAVWQPRNINSADSIAQLRLLAPDILIVVAYGRILKGEVLAIPKLGAVNVHASLLPDLRGAAPIEWAIILGYSETGITTMYMDEGLDTGDIILQQAVSIGPDETGAQLRERLGSLAQTLLPQTVRLIFDGKAPRSPQVPGNYAYAPVLDSALERIDWASSAGEIANRIRALAPKPGCYCTFRKRRLKIIRAVPAPGSAPPGQAVLSKGLGIGTGTGLLEVLTVQPEGKRVITAKEFINGYRIQEGEQFL